MTPLPPLEIPQFPTCAYCDITTKDKTRARIWRNKAKKHRRFLPPFFCNTDHTNRYRAREGGTL